MNKRTFQNLEAASGHIGLEVAPRDEKQDKDTATEKAEKSSENTSVTKVASQPQQVDVDAGKVQSDKVKSNVKIDNSVSKDKNIAVSNASDSKEIQAQSVSSSTILVVPPL